MSIEVKGLTKIYGEQRAVDNISFQINKGEIVGFLGPNGAGKSTTSTTMAAIPINIHKYPNALLRLSIIIF